MQIVIVGAGDTGWSLLSSLREQGTDDIAVIDTDSDRCDKVSREFDVLVLEGDGTDPELLEKAKVDEADALVATTGSDALNTVVAMLGRQAGVETIVVKLEGSGLRSACREIGVTRIVSPALSIASEIHATLRGAHHLDLSLVARAELRLSDLDARGVSGCRIDEVELPGGVLVVALLRDDEPVFPSPDLRIAAGERLLLLAAGDDELENARRRLRPDDGEGETS